jgi:NADH-quinone oxidoreductase subunit D
VSSRAVDRDVLAREAPPPGKPRYDFDGDTMTINMGPQHPSTHGVLRLILEMDGEIIKKVTPDIGYLHRCFEKHAENEPYPGVLPYADRMDYVAAMNMEHGFVVAVERLMKIEVPERVLYIRVIMDELQRIASHLIAVGTFGLDVGNFTPFMYCFRDRERILDLFEWVSGARLLYNYIWIGGLARDLPPGWVEKCRTFLDEFEPLIVELDTILTENAIFIERTATIGFIPVDVALSYGVTGPNLRGSGVDWDLRRDDPYSIYDRFQWKVVTGIGIRGRVGSAWDRYYVRVNEMRESIKIVRQALDALPEGDVTKAIPKRVKPPAGEIYSRTESAKGEIGYYIVSDGSEKPWRVKARSPCFTAISCVNAISYGVMIADAVATVGSLDIVLGEVDR